MTESQGYWTVEALEEFEECVNGCKVTVKAGEQRIVPPNLVHKQKSLPPMVKEHAYELQMEKKLKRMVEKEEKKKQKEEKKKQMDWHNKNRKNEKKKCEFCNVQVLKYNFKLHEKSQKHIQNSIFIKHPELQPTMSISL